jgi:hypothetical protein
VDTSGSKQFKSFQIAEYLKKQKVEDIMAAIRTALQMDPTHKSEELELKYQPTTTQLFALGTPPAVKVAEQVIGSLRGSDSGNSRTQSESSSTASPGPRER